MNQIGQISIVPSLSIVPKGPHIAQLLPPFLPVPAARKSAAELHGGPTDERHGTDRPLRSERLELRDFSHGRLQGRRFVETLRGFPF